jgi:hypothetical protein
VLGIACESLDLTQGFDATDPTHFVDLQLVNFVWLHPPYWRMIPYGGDARCLAEAPTLSEFLQRLGQVFRNCLSRLTPGGAIAVLIVPFRTLQVAESEGLWLAAPEIVRFSHGTTSSRKVYNTSFIPRLHDVCLVLKRREDIAPQWRPEIKVDFGAHLMHRGAFDAMLTDGQNPTVSSGNAWNCVVDTSNPARSRTTSRQRIDSPCLATALATPKGNRNQYRRRRSTTTSLITGKFGAFCMTLRERF